MFRLSLVLFVALSATAYGDTFIFDPTVTPTAGTYVPLGLGHYNYPGAAQSFRTLDPTLTPFVLPATFQVELLEFSQGGVPLNPASGFTCVPLGSDCYNVADFFLAGGTTPILGPGLGSTRVALYNSSGNPLGLIELDAGPDAVFGMLLYTGPNFAPITLSDVSLSFQNALTGSTRVTLTGGLQDVIDARFYDGSLDHFEIGSVPEPSSVVLLITSLIGLAAVVKSRRRGAA